jgi:hypothetical protein
LLKCELEYSDGKEAVNKVFAKKGGLLTSQSAGELPRDRVQAYNMKRKLQIDKMTASHGGVSHDTKDMLYVVMEQCKQAEKTDIFVQDVTCAPEPMSVLCTEQQLIDITRFCCDPFEFCIFGIDPTFNLGDFSVIPTVYKHLLLCDSHTNSSPLLLGPILIHYRKQFRSYNYFLSTLVGLKQEIGQIKAVGTDGERSLVDAVLRNFPQVSHVRCFRHLRNNIERHLNGLNFTRKAVNEYIQDIFGWSEKDGIYHEGLVDCENQESFYVKLEALKMKWNEVEAATFSDKTTHVPKFHEWFMQFKAEEFAQCTLRSLREIIGLGSPPSAFYTNNSEAINAFLKESLGYKKSQWGIFNNKIKDIVKQQQLEMEKSIIGRGRYCLRSQYSFLGVAEDKWFRLSQQQRIKVISKFNTCSVRAITEKEIINNPPQDITIGRFHINDHDDDDVQSGSISVTLDDGIANTRIPYTVAECIWKKAKSLISEVNAIVPAPGLGEKDKMVKSMSGTAPHLVVSRASSVGIQYNCDDKCPQFKSLGICSHIVASSETNGDLQAFLQWFKYVRGKKAPNLSEMGNHEMPKNASRKGGRPSKKKASKKVDIEHRIALEPAYHSEIPQAVTTPNLNSSPQPLENELFQHSSANQCQSLPSPFPSSTTYQPPWMSQNLWHPPPMSPYPPYWTYPTTSTSMSPPSTEQYVVCFKFGNVSVCNGCRNKFTEKDILVIQHKEFRSFTSPQSGLPSSRFGNAYYHLRKRCIEIKLGTVMPISALVIPERTKRSLNSQQRSTIYAEFNVTV